MHAVTLCLILIIVLAILVQGTSADHSVRSVIITTPTPSPTPTQAVLIIPTTTVTTATPQETVTCAAPSQCLAYADAVSQWGDGGFTQSNELPCELSHSVTGATIGKFCFQPKPAAAVTTSPVFQPLTTPVNQFMSMQPTTSPASFSSQQTTPVAVFATPTPTPTQGTNLPGIFNKTFQPLVISIGDYQYRPVLGSDSPYLQAGYNENAKNLPTSFLEVDQFDNGVKAVTPEFPLRHNWVDYTKLTIETTDAEHMANFRYYNATKNVKMFLFQVSRYQFPDDPDHWQGQYVPGLVTQGPVELLWSAYGNDFTENALNPVSALPPGSQESTIDSDGFQYFRINFAKIASRNPGEPPYYDETIAYDMAGTGGREIVTDVDRLPLNAGGITVKKVSLGFFSLDLPTGYRTLSPGEYTESEIGYANTGLTLTCADCAELRHPTPIENLMIEGDQKFYVRLVPIYNDGEGGIPTIPVEVTVHRHQPCPTITGDVVVTPPSARIVWYMRPTWVDNGDNMPNQWVTIGQAAFGNGSVVSFGGSGGISGNIPTVTEKFDIYPSGFHYFVPPVAPVEKSWWEKIVGTFQSIWGFFTFVVNGYSDLWNFMKDQAVNDVATVLSYTLTGDQVKCQDIPGCADVLHETLDMAMVAVGLPPTLPTAPELTDMATDYLVKLGADQMGAGGVYDTAKDIYGELPSQVQTEMQSDAESSAGQLITGESEVRHDAIAFNGQNCEPQLYCNGAPGDCFKNCVNTTLDPIFNAGHPATVMVWVENPNPANSPATDRVSLVVSDSWNLYYPETRIIPSLKPGEGISVPVVLNENYDQFQETGGPCGWDEFAHADTTSWADEGVCEQDHWMDKLYAPGEDTFKVTFAVQNATSLTNAAFANLDATSSGKSAGNFVITDDNCMIYNKIVYPPGWQIYTTGYSINPLAWDYFFEENGVPSLTRGYMRGK